MFVNQKREMDEYICLLLLAYFKKHVGEYSINEISNEIGCSILQTSEYIEILLNRGLLEYHNFMLALSISGRQLLASSDMEYYIFDADISELYEKKRIDENDVYCVHEFAKKKWRGSK